MKQSEFKEWFKNKQLLLGMWTVRVGSHSKGQYVIGCYYDETDSKWKIYQNGERSHVTTFETSDEEKAFNELKDIIEYEIRNNRV